MPISSATEAVGAEGRASAEWRGMLRMARDQLAFQTDSRILKRMNAAVAIVLLAAPFAVLAAFIAVLIVYLGNRTK
jgi:hypothetical protein